MRSNALVVATTADRVLLTGERDASVEFETGDAALWSSLMQRLSGPVRAGEIRDLTASLSERDIDRLGRLVADGFILEDGKAEHLVAVRDRVFSENNCFHLVPGQPVCKHLVIACTGSIVAGLVAPTLLSISYSNFQDRLDVIVSEAAQKFVTRDLLECYGIRTWGDAFERRSDIYVPHVHLARSADCVLVMPASANSLHRLADGACTDLLSSLVAATRAPVVLAPAMNDVMWNNPAVQRNLQRLRDDGMYVIEPTIICGAADLASRGEPMYGGHGTMWTGPHSLMQALSRIMQSHGERLPRGPVAPGPA